MQRGGTVTPKVAVGGSHTAVLKSDGTVWATGYNQSGQLGVGDAVASGSSDSKTATFTQCVDADGQPIQDATDVACGYSHTAIIRNNGEVWQCGLNQYGQLGNTSVASGSDSNYSTEFVKSSNITGATQIACGDSHTAVIVNGEVWQCGRNNSGQLGNNSTATSTEFVKSSNISGATQIACGGNHTAVRVNGEVWQCGYNGKGQLGNNSTTQSPVFVKSSNIRGATQIACGGNHTAVIVNGEIWQCGYNYYGQFGNTSVGSGYTSSYSTEFVKSSNITNANELSTGCKAYHTMALCIENDIYTLYGAGRNNNGQLGLGDAAGTGNVSTFTKSTTISDIGVYIVPDIEAIAALGEGSSRNVTGAGQFVGGYGLQIEWSDLQYTYTATWNKDESKWDGAWEAAEGNDQIVVKNASATPCKVEFAFSTNDEFKSPSDGEPGTKGTFADPKVTDEPALDTTTNTVPLAVYTTDNQVANQKTVKLGLDGIPNAKAGTDITEATKVGIVTVTLKNS